MLIFFLLGEFLFFTTVTLFFESTRGNINIINTSPDNQTVRYKKRALTSTLECKSFTLFHVCHVYKPNKQDY